MVLTHTHTVTSHDKQHLSDIFETNICVILLTFSFLKLPDVWITEGGRVCLLV